MLSRLDAAMDASGWVGLLADLVRARSHPGIERQEEEAALVLSRWLEERGIEASLTEAAPGRPNVLASVRGAGPGRRLVLCGHLDTVPLNAGDPGAGFSAEITGGRMHGRGTTDMKGALAAMATALVGLRETGALPAGTLTIAAIADEEMESRGAEAFLRSGEQADGAIVGEPTENRLALGHKGLEWLEVEFTGRAAHGGTPGAGINAISAAARFIALAEERLTSTFAARTHPLLGPPTLNFGTIEGGDQPSTVARRCAVRLDRRTVPGETYDSVIAELTALTGAVEAAAPGLTTAICRVPGSMLTMEHLSTVLDAAHPLARAVESARRAVTGALEPPTSFPAWTDAALLSAFGGIPSVVLGPGDLSVAHTPRESVSLEEVRAAARIYARAAIAFCGS